MTSKIHVYIGDNAINPLIDFCRQQNISKLMLVADGNTYAAFGEAVNQQLTANGFDVKTSVLSGNEVIANEHYFVQVLLDTDQQIRTYLAVGSGSITDITRFVSYHTRCNFIAVPTAASVDGFTGAGAPSVIDGFKKTIYCHSPLAVFGDIDVLSAAPQKMIASGFGDMLGKYTALADWKLGALLWNEPFDAQISQRVEIALEKCVNRVDEIGSASPEGIQALMDGLIESGLCMLDANNSRPASGAEHQISHHLEMKLIWEGRPAVLHGEKVGASTIIVARLYEQLRQMSRDEMMDQLEAISSFPKEKYTLEINAVYPSIADKVLAEQAAFLNMSDNDFEQLKQTVANNWAEIQAIAATVPSPEQLTDYIRRAGGETELTALGFSDNEITEAATYSHYLRNRFNVDKLGHLLGIE